MTIREELHKLIDSLPEGAMEAAHRVLTNMQVWPPPPPPTLEEMRKRMEEHRQQVMQRQTPGTIGGFGGGDSYDPAKGAGPSGFHYWEGDTFVAETAGPGIQLVQTRQYKGHELKVIERK